MPNWARQVSTQGHDGATASATGRSTGSDARRDRRDAPGASGEEQPAARGVQCTNRGTDPAATVSADPVGGRGNIPPTLTRTQASRSTNWRRRTIRRLFWRCLIAGGGVGRAAAPFTVRGGPDSSMLCRPPLGGVSSWLNKAILDRMGFSPEDRRRRYRTVQLGTESQPFTFAQHLKDTATRWLQPGKMASEERML